MASVNEGSGFAPGLMAPLIQLWIRDACVSLCSFVHQAIGAGGHFNAHA